MGGHDLMDIPTNALFARYEARLHTGLSDGSLVNLMPDQSGNGYNLFQAETAQTWRTGIVNGMPSYYFAGNGAYQASSVDYPSLASNDSSITISVIVNSNNPGGSRTWPLGLSEGDSTSLFAFTDGVQTGKWGAFLRGVTNVGQINYTTSNDTIWSVLTMVYDGSTVKSYINGTEVDSQSASGLQTMNRIAIGKVVGQTWEGYLAGAFVWKTGLTNQERAQFHTYVQDTYGIIVSDYKPQRDLLDSTPKEGLTTYPFGFNGLYYAGQSIEGQDAEIYQVQFRLGSTNVPTNGYVQAFIYDSLVGTTAASNARPVSTSSYATSSNQINLPLGVGGDIQNVTFTFDTPFEMQEGVDYVVGLQYVRDVYDQNMSIQVLTDGHSGNYSAQRTDQANPTVIGSVDLYFELYGVANGSPVGSTAIKVWNGTDFVVKPLYAWDGTNWAQKPLKVWDGTNWLIEGSSGPPPVAR